MGTLNVWKKKHARQAEWTNNRTSNATKNHLAVKEGGGVGFLICKRSCIGINNRQNKVQTKAHKNGPLVSSVWMNCERRRLQFIESGRKSIDGCMIFDALVRALSSPLSLSLSERSFVCVCLFGWFKWIWRDLSVCAEWEIFQPSLKFHYASTARTWSTEKKCWKVPL